MEAEPLESRRGAICGDEATESRKEIESGEPSRLKSFAFLGVLAHLLSQPLTALRGTLELALLMGQRVGDYRLAVEESLESADRLTRLICLLRELAEAEVPGPLIPQAELGDVVKEAVEDLRPWADSNGVNLALDLRCDPQVGADPERLRRAILKVVHNAVLRNREGGVVRVSLSSSQGDARLAIADEGRSFPPEELSRLFEPFPGGCGARETTAESHLEWAIAKRIVEAMGGSIGVETLAPQGCCFWIRFPMTSTKDLAATPQGGLPRECA